MAGKKNMGENGKKASGNQQKQEAAAAKAAAQQQVKATDEAADWGKGAKSSAKKYVCPLRDLPHLVPSPARLPQRATPPLTRRTTGTPRPPRRPSRRARRPRRTRC